MPLVIDSAVKMQIKFYFDHIPEFDNNLFEQKEKLRFENFPGKLEKCTFKKDEIRKSNWKEGLNGEKMTKENLKENWE